MIETVLRINWGFGQGEWKPEGAEWGGKPFTEELNGFKVVSHIMKLD